MDGGGMPDVPRRRPPGASGFVTGMERPRKTPGGFPDWGSFTPEAAEVSLARLLDAARLAVDEIERAMPRDYESLVWRLDDAVSPLMREWGMVCHMTAVMNSAEWRRTEENFQPRMVEFSLRVGQSETIYRAAKDVLAALPADAGTRRRILERMVRDAELSGVALDDGRKRRFAEISSRLAKLSSDFSNAVIDATAAFKFEKGGKTYTIDDAAYPETMKHCADREVRETLCRARATRAPENGPRIAEILSLRSELASMLGFGSYAELSLSRKCAPSVAAVYGMVDRLDAATLAPAEREAAELGEGLEPWDVAFEAERLRERKYSYSEDELKRHFEFDDVLRGLFAMAKFLFGIDIEERTGGERPPAWHPDVRFFAVLENGEELAHFYLDPFVRNGLKRGGAWMNEFRDRSVRPGVSPETPLAVMVLNLPERDANGRCLMPWREVQTLFHEFGHALQCMLTRVDERDAAGINLVEWDAVEVASQFMENWCLDDRTGIMVPAELKAKVRAAENFRAATACRRQLAFATTDMDLHSAPAADPNAGKNSVFDRFGVPRVEEDRFLESFTHIFAGGYAAGYYGYKWAEVMSADCYGAFEEAGLSDDGSMRTLGMRFRDTILALGGSVSALEAFRRFRGRDPDVAALLRQRDLI